MDKQKDTKKLGAEELEKRAAPFGSTLYDKDSGAPIPSGETFVPEGSTEPGDESGGGEVKPGKK